MKSLNPTPENGRRIGVIGLGLRPDHRPSSFNVKVSHGSDEHEVTVTSNSSFGDLKSFIAQKIGLKPEKYKLLFRGKEKEDDEDLQTAGVKENSKVLLVEVTSCEQESPEEVKESSVISRGGEAVAEVRKEVDKLSIQVSALQAVVDSGTKADDKGIIYMTEMLMRQLLKLDGIDAEGEGKVQRKMEVRRVQSLVETMDILKSRNSNPSSNVDNTASVSTQWEGFEASGDPNASSPLPFSAPPSVSSSAPSPVPSSSPSHMPSSSSSPVPACDSAPASSYNPPTPPPSYAPSPIPSYAPSPVSSYATSPMPSYDPSLYPPSPMPSYNPNLYPPPPGTAYMPSPYAPSPAPSYAPYPEQSHIPYPGQTHAPYPGQSHAPYTEPSHTPYPEQPYQIHYPAPSQNVYPAPSYAVHPAQSYAPHPTPSHAPPMPSATKVTQDWERFD